TWFRPTSPSSPVAQTGPIVSAPAASSPPRPCRRRRTRSRPSSATPSPRSRGGSRSRQQESPGAGPASQANTTPRARHSCEKAIASSISRARRPEAAAIPLPPRESRVDQLLRKRSVDDLVHESSGTTTVSEADQVDEDGNTDDAPDPVENRHGRLLTTDRRERRNRRTTRRTRASNRLRRRPSCRPPPERSDRCRSRRGLLIRPGAIDLRAGRTAHPSELPDAPDVAHDQARPQ